MKTQEALSANWFQGAMKIFESDSVGCDNHHDDDMISAMTNDGTACQEPSKTDPSSGLENADLQLVQGAPTVDVGDLTTEEIALLQWRRAARADVVTANQKKEGNRGADEEEATTTVSKMPGRSCTPNLSDWCAANGLPSSVCSSLQEIGAESFYDVSSLKDEEDKEEMINEMTGLKFLQKKKLSYALSSKFLALYEKCIREQNSAEEYVQLQKCERLLTSEEDPPTPKGSNPERALLQEVDLPALKEAQGGRHDTTVKTKCSQQFPRGQFFIEHKVIVLDREKAINSNPLLPADCFVSLDEDPFSATAGGELRVVLFVGATGSGKSTTINSYINYLYGVTF